jgi:hypothetical protein
MCEFEQEVGILELWKFVRVSFDNEAFEKFHQRLSSSNFYDFSTNPAIIAIPSYGNDP